MRETLQTTAQFEPQQETDLIDHIGVDLWKAFRAYESAMFDMVVELGFPDISVTDSEILVLVGSKGAKLVDIARGRRISKQAAHEQIQSLIKREYLQTKVDPDDRRVKRVTYTKKGMLLARSLIDVKSALHSKVEAALGVNELVQLERLLAAVSKAVR